MEPEVYLRVKSSVKKLLDIDLNNYKDEQMKRRLDSWLVRSAKGSWEEYLHHAAANTIELNRFRDYLTINVTEFFRDPERWEALRRTALPDLVHGAKNGLRVWSAGCSIGVEAYTLAMLLDEELPLKDHYLLATDLDRGALAKARARGPYNPDEIRNLSQAQRSKYLTAEAGNRSFIKESLARKVTFKEQDLFAPSFETGFDLLVCRNVVIYFTSDAKTELYHKFYKALRPGGILFLGGTEIIPHPAEIGFRNHGISFYIKP
jgi:chemotaxis protein methyltransferase CheR